MVATKTPMLYIQFVKYLSSIRFSKLDIVWIFVLLCILSTILKRYLFDNITFISYNVITLPNVRKVPPFFLLKKQLIIELEQQCVL